MRIFNITDLDQLVERVERLFPKPVAGKRDYTGHYYEEEVQSPGDGKEPVGYVFPMYDIESGPQGDVGPQLVWSLYGRFLDLRDIGFRELSWCAMPYFRESREVNPKFRSTSIRCRVICR